MSVSFVVYCNDCGAVVDRHVGVTSGLGPPVQLCPSCGREWYTDRWEWPDMGLVQKGKYVGLSLVYAVGGGMLLALAWVGGYAAGKGPGTEETWPALLRLSLMFLSAWGLAFMAVLGLQAYRVQASIRRRGPHGVAFRAPFFTLQVGLQTRFVLFLLVIALMGAVIGWLV